MHKTNWFVVFVNMHKNLLILLAGVLAGSFLMNQCSDALVAGLGLYDETYINTMETVSIDYVKLLQYVAIQRFRLAFVVGLFMLLKQRRWILKILLLGAGFIVAVLFHAAVMQQGAAGLVLAPATLFPQWIFYGIAFRALLILSENEHMHTMQNMHIQNILLVLMLLLIGIGTEVLVNPMVIKSVIFLMK